MMKMLIALLLLGMSVSAHAAEGDVPLDRAHVNLSDRASLQRGAQLFVNYCLSCHSAEYMRYSRMARDLGLSETVVRENMMFASDRIHDRMTIAMTPADAEAFFNVVPPDLSVISRYRGADWLYTFLRGFYRDGETVTGWNNAVFGNTAMPHVLYELQGTQRAVFENDVFQGFETESPGRLSAERYDAAMGDLVNFLVYMGEPAALVRYRIGVWVLLFLGLLAGLTWLLKKEYWRDVH